ncbi:MAG: hypothetical protein JXX28_15055 [Deltaproteobacteria bacterium]|nr:hypothetical protein [Deltaproteobacteria bacterium]
MKTMLYSLLAMSVSLPAWAGPLKPYGLGAPLQGTVEAQLPVVKQALVDQGFQVVGTYYPTGQSAVLAVTNGALRGAAAASEQGGFGAVQRVSLTQSGDQVEVAFTDPRYFGAAYHMSGDLSPVATALGAAVGGSTPFGAASGLSEADLRGYHYTIAMPYFGDQEVLATYGSHQEAVAAVEAGLRAHDAGTRLVYKVQIPGTEQVVFGVGLTAGKGADSTVLSNCDVGEHRATAYAPYEILVVGDKALALPGKFRIAIAFPDLSMGTFMKISSAPGAISEALTEVAKP